MHYPVTDLAGGNHSAPDQPPNPDNIWGTSRKDGTRTCI